MSSAPRATWTMSAAALVAFSACGGPGLPPAGPTPGEEVDVGYGTRGVTETTGAITSVPEGAVTGNPRHVEELLRGRVAGLQVLRGGGRTTYRIRGVNSLLNDQEPLFIVDGIPVPAGGIDGVLAAVSPEDIRQIDVLKDVASTSIYGTRGAGGVIIINTRR
jgi:TonB-dependent starch-binding outer membrane protein SusC